jgi:hypothetical protein
MAWFFNACSRNDTISGNTSETTNTLTIAGNAFYQDNEPATGVKVILRRSELAAPTESPVLTKAALFQKETTTDSKGFFRFDSLEYSRYSVEVNDGSLASTAYGEITQGNESVVLEDMILIAPGSLSGIINLEGGNAAATLLVFLSELDRFSITDSSGAFLMEDVPMGGHRLQIIVQGDFYFSYEYGMVQVSAGKNTDLGTIIVPY